VLDNANLYDSAMKEIVERKRTESLLQESEARFRQIVENASDIIYRADMDGNFTYANPSALKMMGYASEQEVLGRKYLDLTTPEFRHKLKRIYDHQYISKTKNTYYEFPAVTEDGQIVWVGQNVQLIMDGERVIGFQAVARNITQLKQAQEALALSRDQAMDASRFKSQLLSRVSHELRTPLGGILGYAELLQYKAFGPLTEKQHNAVNNIIESTDYLTSIVNDLLDESQIESKSISLHNEYFNPIELLEKTKTTMSTLADKKGLAFRVEIDPELPSELYGDVNRLQQILINLEGNAIKFTKLGEVNVSLKRPAPAQWSIEVRDTGAGIPVDDQQNIFEPFRQVSNSITRENRGSGLGLAITKQLVELMGGQISLESEIGKGSLFTVTLPITNAPGE
jgi:PAS domain S-box-containing protein